MNIVDIPADPSWPQGFTAWGERQKRMRILAIRRKHIPWNVRKKAPHLAEDLERYWARTYEAQARHYMGLSYGTK